MEPNDVKALEAVIEVVQRYGIKRATMDEFARHSGLSRQTLYDRYGSKDGVIAAAIELTSLQLEEALRSAFAKDVGIDRHIDAFYEIAVIPIFEAMQRMPDAADLEKGLGAASNAASRCGSETKTAVLAELFARFLPEGSAMAEPLATFFEQSCRRAKLDNVSREELDAFLAVLKLSTLSLVHNSSADLSP